MILIRDLADINEIGGKAYQLLSLRIKNTPALYVIPASFFESINGDQRHVDVLKAELAGTLKGTRLYAVRSSAIDEDSPNASFAGVHESFLNVRADEVLDYALRVYRSAFSERAMEYRRAKGLSTEGIRIAVIVQEMVQADVAGVAFSINPVTDNPDETVISATRGLGDRLVNGEVSGTTYTVSNGEVRLKGEALLTKKQLRNLIRMISVVVQRTEA